MTNLSQREKLEQFKKDRSSSLQRGVFKPKAPGFHQNIQNQQSKNPFVSSGNLSKKPSVGKKSLDPFMSNSTSPFRQNLNGGRNTIAVVSNGLAKNKENNCTPKRVTVQPFIKGSKSPYKQTMSIQQITKLRFENEL
jgi:hypothetical protein